MSWADNYIEKLRKRETVQFRPIGNSMVPHIVSGSLVTVEPLNQWDYQVGDIVLCEMVSGKQYLHFIKKKQKHSMLTYTYLIGNAGKNHTNGWTTMVYGKVTKVEQ